MHPFFQSAYENKNPSQTTDDLCSENCLGIPIVYFPVFSNLVIYRRTFSLTPISLNIIEESSSQSFVVLFGFNFFYYLKLEYVF